MTTIKTTIVLLMVSILVMTGCEKNPASAHEESYVIEMTMFQNDSEVTVLAKGVEAELVFSVESADSDHSHGGHMTGLSPQASLEGHDEHMDVHAEGELYAVHHTFAEAGNYEMHFNFENEGTEYEEHFDIICQ